MIDAITTIINLVSKSLVEQGVLGVVIILLCAACIALWRSRNKAIDFAFQINEKRITEAKENYERMYDLMTATNNILEKYKTGGYNDKRSSEKDC